MKKNKVWGITLFDIKTLYSYGNQDCVVSMKEGQSFQQAALEYLDIHKPKITLIISA